MARFPYFQRLSAEDKRIYVRSDELRSVKVPDAAALAPLVGELREALEAGKRVGTAKAANALMRALCKQLGAPNVRVRVREVRPSWESGELHGLYTFAEARGATRSGPSRGGGVGGEAPDHECDGEPAEPTAARSSEASVRSEAMIEVWMRTVAHKRVVKFKTFFRTLLHEVVHHLDATIYEMKESFHTEGFFARESSLFKQLIAETETESATETETETALETAKQLSLFDDVKAPAPRRARRGG